MARRRRRQSRAEKQERRGEESLKRVKK